MVETSKTFAKASIARSIIITAMLLIGVASIRLYGQASIPAPSEADRQARTLYFQALDAYYAGRMPEALEKISAVDKALGSTNARSSALKARILFDLKQHRDALATLDEYFRVAGKSDPMRGELQALREALAVLEAERIKKETEEDDRRFRLAVEQGTMRALFDYIKANPQSKNAREAQRLADEEGARIGRAFDASPGLSHVRRYLSNFGSGPDYQRLVDYLIAEGRKASRDGSLKVLEEAATIALDFKPRGVDLTEAMEWRRQAASKIDMIRIQGGTIRLITSGGATGPSQAISTILISRTEITQAQYQAVMGSNPSYFIEGSDAPLRPVERVTWFDAVAFCNALSLREKLTPVYRINGTSVTANWNANGYRLPTEAEWEYAARGGNLSRGHNFSGGNDASAVAWTSANSGKSTHPVARKASNEIGLYDMTGNVYEWVWDWFATYPSGGASRDTRGPTSGSERSVRGGSWANSPLVIGMRGRLTPDSQSTILGFRIVKNVD